MPRARVAGRSLALAALTLLALCTTDASGSTRPGASLAPPRAQQQLANKKAETPREKYFALAERYCTGDADAALRDLDSWDWPAFNNIRRELRESGKWTPRDIQCVVMLHTDRALRAQAGSLTETSHLNWARELLHLFDGQPLLDRSARLFRRDWYVALAAHLQGQLRFIELDTLLRDAARIFRDDPAVLLTWGLMREAQISPRLAAVVAGLPGRSENYLGPFPDRAGALREAEEYYIRVLAGDVASVEARVRLGRVLALRERPDEALQSLEEARRLSRGSRLTYLAWMFTGQISQRQGQLPQAAEAYRSAAALYPECQAATIALSFVVREMGNGDEAQRLVRQTLEHGASGACDDPWWTYDLGLAPQSDAMLDRLREEARR